MASRKSSADKKWIEIPFNPSRLSEHSESNGVHVTIMLSPYDIPEAVSGYHDDDLGRFVIEFRYLDDEPWRREPRDEVLTIRIGRHTRRLFGIEIDVEKAEVDHVSMEIAQTPAEEMDRSLAGAFASLNTSAESKRVKNNYSLAYDSIRKQRDSLYSALTKV